MKEFSTDRIRNLCLAGQRGCGKTSLGDAIAFCTGLNNRIGRVDDGSSMMDYTEAEQAKKSSITSKLLACEHNGTKINLLDCPGHSDFVGEMLGSLRVCESAGIVINATSGVEVGTLLQWNLIAKAGMARFFFVNKIESENVLWKKNVESIQEAFGKQAVPVQLPIGEAAGFKGIVDLLTMKAYTFDNSGKRSEVPIPDELKGEAESEREKLVEVAAESNDELLEKFFEQGTLTDSEFLEGLRIGIGNAKVYPILFGSAVANMGVQVLLDFISQYLPSPLFRPSVTALKTASDEAVDLPVDSSGKVVAYVYKIVSEGHLGDMSFFRAYSGALKSGGELANQQTDNTERITQLFTMQGKNRVEVSSVPAGDIGVLVKLKNTHVGNTLSEAGLPVSIAPTEFPNPVMDVAIRSKSKGDEDKVAAGLQRIREEDPTFKLVADAALKQQVLYGQGPTHIESIVEKLRNRFGVEVELVRPKIPYRETIRKKAESKYKHKKQSGGRGQYGEVYLRLEPNEKGAGFEFSDVIKGGVIPGKYVPAVEKGIIEALTNGGLCGAPVVDVKVAVYYGSYHDVDSSDMAFKIAGLMAFRHGFMDANPVIMEPIFNVQINVPDDFTGDVMGDLSSRRGKIAGMDPDGRHQIIRASVPQSELHNYAVDLRSMTQGQGVYSTEFSHYENVPHEVSQKIIDEAKHEKEKAD